MNYNPIDTKDGVEALDCNVYEAAKYRIKKIIPKFDNICVTFTGGKDSTVVLYLVDECMKELGRTDKVKVAFEDEEIVPKDTLEFVDSLVKSEKYDFYYFCVPIKASAQLLGKDIKYVQWDKNREWYREPPDYAITSEDVGNIILKDGMTDKFRLMLNLLNGSVIMFNGYRSDESYAVYKSVMAKPHETYLSISKISPRLSLCKPIYDWKNKDVFLYLFKNNLEYNPIYNTLLWCDMPLRSNIPLGKSASVHLAKYKLYDPDYYNQLVYMFPDLEASSRYMSEVSLDKVAEKYGKNPEGMIKYIKENVDDFEKQSMLGGLRRAIRRRNSRLKKGEAIPFGGYSYYRMYSWLVHGHTLYERNFYSLSDFLFEGYSAEDYREYCLNKGEY